MLKKYIKIRAPNPNTISADIPVSELPHCQKNNCKGLLRPDIVWFGENLDENILEATSKYFEDGSNINI